MPLTYTDEKVPYLGGTSFQATDKHSGKAVVVRATDEAIQDYGEVEVMAMGETKYDDRVVGGTDAIVVVSTSDFMESHQDDA